jgi:dCMP deaminase
MSRLTLDRWGLVLARSVALRATCIRRSVGCVLLDDLGHVLATGYNGPARGTRHCENLLEPSDDPMVCRGHGFPSGKGLEICQAVHAEQNALMQCPDVERIRTCCVTTSPCLACVKMLMNTRCERIVFNQEYDQAQIAMYWWTHSVLGRSWVRLSEEQP